MVVGLGIFTWLLWMAWKGRFTPAYHTPLEIGGLYWHFVDIVWIYLFPSAISDRPAINMRHVTRCLTTSKSSPLGNAIFAVWGALLLGTFLTYEAALHRSRPLQRPPWL